MKRLAAVVCLVFALSAALYGQESGGYEIGPGDVLAIKVWGQDAMDRQVAVSSAGKLTFPLVGKIQVAGLTAEQLEEKLTALLANGYIRNPQVNVTIVEYNSHRVYIYGELTNPQRAGGVFTMRARTTLLELLATYGGTTDQAARTLIVLRKRAAGPAAVTDAAAPAGDAAGEAEQGAAAKPEGEKTEGEKGAAPAEETKTEPAGAAAPAEPEGAEAETKAAEADAPAEAAAGAAAEGAQASAAGQPAGKEAGRPGNAKEAVGDVDLLMARAGKDTQIIRIDLLKLISGDTTQNIELKSGDIVLVPRRSDTVRRVFIIGDVEKQGAMPLAEDSSLAKLIPTVGVPISDAVTVTVYKGGESVDKAPSWTTKEIVLDQKADKVVLQDGDFVYFRRASRVFYVVGEVRAPGGFFWKENLTVREAIVMAGWTTPQASTGRIKALRLTDGKWTEKAVALDDRVQEGDIISVPERWF